MSRDAAPAAFEPPLDHAELLARVRFSLDHPIRITREAVADQRNYLKAFEARAMNHFVRLTPKLFPGIHRSVHAACERLMLADEPTVYIAGDSTPNACAVQADGRYLIALNSSLVTLLEPEELSSVIGHEIGHATFQHSVEPPTSFALEMFLLETKRAQELSADRAGLLAAPDPMTALRAELKLGCGLAGPHLTPDIDAYIEQISEPPPDVDRNWEARVTHPSLAFRFWAQRVFAESDVFRALKQLPGGRPLEQVETEIEDRFDGIGNSAAFRATADHVHESLAWLGVLIVVQDDDVTKLEREVLVDFVGRIWADDACAYARRHGLAAVERRAVEMLAPLRLANLRARRRIEAAVREFGVRVGAPQRAQEMLRLIERAVAP